MPCFLLGSHDERHKSYFALWRIHPSPCPRVTVFMELFTYQNVCSHPKGVMLIISSMSVCGRSLDNVIRQGLYSKPKQNSLRMYFFHFTLLLHSVEWSLAESFIDIIIPVLFSVPEISNLQIFAGRAELVTLHYIRLQYIKDVSQQLVISGSSERELLLGALNLFFKLQNGSTLFFG